MRLLPQGLELQLHLTMSPPSPPDLQRLQGVELNLRGVLDSCEGMHGNHLPLYIQLEHDGRMWQGGQEQACQRRVERAQAKSGLRVRHAGC